MLTERASGVLLHPTSLPTPFGVGDFGPEAYRFVNWLADAGQQYWQVLPLVPTDRGDSPYQSPSAFAGNPLLISLELLRDDGLLNDEELAAARQPHSESAPRVDFDAARRHKLPALEAAAQRLRQFPPAHPLHHEFDVFCRLEAEWLGPHALFMALREAHDGAWWLNWTRYVTSDRRASADAAVELGDRLETHRMWQFWFYRQWSRLRDFARRRGVRVIGDIPIYVSHDSADVWANRDWFQLDADGRSTFVAGVPPDYFSATGQLWSNPLYDWEALRRRGYEWWLKRLRAALKLVDLVRLDHFRGFESYWSIPAAAETAVEGRWEAGPRDDFLAAMRDGLQAEYGGLPIIAEDLGMITEEVHALRRRFDLPGMNVLQFRLPGDPWEPPFAPTEFEPNSVVYTGTHDNDTTRGWFESDILPQPERLEQLRRITPCDPDRIAWELLEIAWISSSLLAIAPLQDVLQLGHEARMNTPGTCGEESNNWRWKYVPGMLTADVQQRLRELTQATDRLA